MTFPTSPAPGDTYYDPVDNTTWTYNGVTWDRTTVGVNNKTLYTTSSGGGGPAENGIPVGGTAGQHLVKSGAEDYAATWVTPTASYTDFFLGSFAGSNNYPASAIQGQWIIDSDKDEIIVWDSDGNQWAETAVLAQAVASIDFPYQYVYSSTDGTGYGFEGAYPTLNWSNTPDGKLQTTGYSSNILSRRVKFATLQNPGDEVTFRATDNLTAFNRYCIIGLTKGTDDESLSWKVAGQPSSGTAWMLTDAADRAKVEFYMAYIEPYWGGTSYGANLVGRSNSNGLSGLSGNQGELPITFKVEADYRIGVYIDGHFHVQTNVVPTGGVDFYLSTYGETGRTFYQPTGTLNTPTANTPQTTPAAPTARYWMSAAGLPSGAVSLASGGGFTLYSRDTAGNASDVELTDTEAAAAAFCRVFIDYSDMTLAERAESTEPVVAQDQIVLDAVQYLARGYFHSLDLDLTEIQAKMALYNDALAAAKAGSVEATLGQLQALTIPSGGGSAEAFPYDPNYVFNATGYDTSYQNYYAGDPVYDTYGVSKIEFSGSFISIHFVDSNAMTAWRSQDQIFEVVCPTGSYSWEKPLTLNSAAEYTSSFYNYVSYHLPNQLTIAEKEELADVAASLSGSPFDIQINNSGQSPAQALGETAVVAELIAKLQLHLAKFPR